MSDLKYQSGGKSYKRRDKRKHKTRKLLGGEGEGDNIRDTGFEVGGPPETQSISSGDVIVEGENESINNVTPAEIEKQAAAAVEVMKKDTTPFIDMYAYLNEEEINEFNQMLEQVKSNINTLYASYDILKSDDQSNPILKKYNLITLNAIDNYIRNLLDYNKNSDVLSSDNAMVNALNVELQSYKSKNDKEGMKRANASINELKSNIKVHQNNINDITMNILFNESEKIMPCYFEKLKKYPTILNNIKRLIRFVLLKYEGGCRGISRSIVSSGRVLSNVRSSVQTSASRAATGIRGVGSNVATGAKNVGTRISSNLSNIGSTLKTRFSKSNAKGGKRSRRTRKNKVIKNKK